MKGKLKSVGRVAMALVLAVSLGLVMAVPVSADVSKADVTLSTNLAEAKNVQYTISFDIGVSLAIGNTITLIFDSAYSTPASFQDDAITVEGTGIVGTSVVVGDNEITITLPMAISTAANPVEVVLTSAANMPNPVAGTYTIDVKTQAEDSVVKSESYTISALPTVTDVQPNMGNVGDTMWVEVTGTGFTGSDTECTTSFDFGAGVSVVPGTYHYIDSTSVDCQITITGSGTARDVVVTTLAGTSLANPEDGDNFTPNPPNTPQVDVWQYYNPTGTFNADSLALRDQTNTISDAVTAASSGDTLRAHAATYEENVVIDKSVSLVSIDGPATTIIDASAETAEAVRGAVNIGASNVTLGGDGVGFTIIAPNATDNPGPYGIELWTPGTMNSVTVQGNTIKGSTTTGSSSPQYGIHFWRDESGGTFSDLLIKDNTFTTTFVTDTTIEDGLSCGMVAGDNVTSISGTFDGNSITGYGKGIMLHVLDGTTTFSNNTVQSCDYEGIDVGSTGTLTISGNTVSGNAGAGIDIREVKEHSTVTENSIHDNGDGIKVRDNTNDKITINYNDIYSNNNTTAVLGESYGPPLGYYKNCGVLNEHSDNDLEAKYNWFGHIGGPSAGTDAAALGGGDKVSTDVIYDPWLTEPQATVITNGIRSYGSDAITLEPGWNTLSVPCGLKTTGDTFGEIEDMGTYLDNLTIGYWYDASESDPLLRWKQVTDSTTLEPGKGFYVKMSDSSSFPVLLFDGLVSLPSYDLYAGWNLVGSMFGIGDDFGVNTADKMKPSVALDSIQTSGSVIISPSVPGQTEAWATTVADNEDELLCVGEAYWIFMEADGTLAGWEILPFSFTPGGIPSP